MPVASAGRLENRSFTATGISAWAKPRPMPTPNVSCDQERGARDDRPRDAEDADDEQADRDRVARAVAFVRAPGRGQREQSHAEDGDRAEQARDRVRDVEVVLDRRDQRADTDDLRPQREPREEQPREEARASAHYPAVTGFVSAPSPSISIVISSPGCMKTRRLAECADAGGRAGGDQVARLERDRLRDVGDQLGDAEDHVRRSRTPASSRRSGSPGSPSCCGSGTSSRGTSRGPDGAEGVGRLARASTGRRRTGGRGPRRR